MSDFFLNMLLGRLPTEVPKGKGRVVSFAGSDTDIRLTTGTMCESVLGFLYMNGISCVARDIAAGINNNQSRVTKTLKALIELGEVVSIKHEGCVMEYTLTNSGLKALKSSKVFTDIKP